eukprot:361947-Chlamydomonas_euryale.AAC.9
MELGLLHTPHAWPYAGRPPVRVTVEITVRRQRERSACGSSEKRIAGVGGGGEGWVRVQLGLWRPFYPECRKEAADCQAALPPTRAWGENFFVERAPNQRRLTVR